MFDVGWQEILVIGIVALIVVGPKELPTLLRTVGRYLGIVKRQAAEFRAQFDEAMRETEFEQLKKDVEKIRDDAESTLRDVETSVSNEIGGVRRELDSAAESVAGASHPDAHDANGLPMAGATSTGDAGGAGAAAIAAAAAAAPPPGARNDPTPPAKVDA